MINKLNTHYSMTNPASVYDEESLTALELAGRTTAKVNEVVDAQNNLSENVTNTLNEQNENIVKIRTVTVPDDVSKEVQKQINNGTFDGAISKYAGELTDRVDNLLGSMTEGSITSMDAEVIDVRLGADGKIYNNAGESIRSNINSKVGIDMIFENGFKNLYTGNPLSMNYNGVDLYKYSVSDVITLEEGNYTIICKPTNYISLIVGTINADNTLSPNRLLNVVPSPIETSSFNFVVTPEFVNKSIHVVMNVSRDTPNTAGTYTGEFYIFKANETPQITTMFQHPISLLTSATVNSNVKQHLHITDASFFYNSGLPWILMPVGEITLPKGEYQTVIEETNCLTVIMTDRTTNERIVDIRPNLVGVNKFVLSEEHTLVITMNVTLSDPRPNGNYYVKNFFIFDDGDLLPSYLLPKMSNTSIENGYFVKSQNTLVPVSTLSLDEKCDVKYNKTLIFNGEFETFSGVEVGHGKGSYGGSYVKVDNNNIYVYGNTGSDTLLNTYAHGLTISDFITVIVDVGVGVADITLFTSTGMFTQKGVTWEGCNGSIFATSLNTTFTNTSLKWTAKDITQKIWVFGDSYLNAKSDARHPYYLYEMGYKNWLASGYPGASSTPELQSLQSLLKIGKPEILVWCLGMNNGDNGAVNSTWMNDLNTVKSLCDTHGITLILATIPTCPQANNTYKNDVVRQSGYRYIDFNKAVGVSGTSWYAGMLSSDNIHPTSLGAKALARQFVIDVPEITIGG